MNTVPKTLPEAPNRRAVLAFIALADAPMPEQVKFGVNPALEVTSTLWLHLDSGAEVEAWATLLAVKLDRVKPHVTEDGKTLITSAGGRLSGWNVTLWATDDASDHRAAIDDETRAELTALVQS